MSLRYGYCLVLAVSLSSGVVFSGLVSANDSEYKEAGIKYSKGDYHGALSLYEKLISSNTNDNNVDYYYGLAMMSAAQLRQYGKALDYCDVMAQKYFGWQTKGDTRRVWDDRILEFKKTLELDAALGSLEKKQYLEKTDSCIRKYARNVKQQIQFQSPTFREAGYKEVRFLPFFEPFNNMDLNKEEYAPEWYKSWDKHTLTPDISKRLQTVEAIEADPAAGEEKYLEYEASLPRYITETPYYFISAPGIERIVLKSYSRHIGVVLSGEKMDLAPDYFNNGELVSTGLRFPDKSDTGFVMRTNREYAIVDHKDKGTRAGGDPNAIHTNVLTAEDQAHLKIIAPKRRALSGYSFSIAGAKYIYMNWFPEDCNCNNLSILYREAADKLEEVSYCGYGRD